MKEHTHGQVPPIQQQLWDLNKCPVFGLEEIQVECKTQHLWEDATTHTLIQTQREISSVRKMSNTKSVSGRHFLHPRITPSKMLPALVSEQSRCCDSQNITMLWWWWYSLLNIVVLIAVTYLASPPSRVEKTCASHYCHCEIHRWLYMSGASELKAEGRWGDMINLVVSSNKSCPQRELWKIKNIQFSPYDWMFESQRVQITLSWMCR